jgi:hypothetical protein
MQHRLVVWLQMAPLQQWLSVPHRLAAPLPGARQHRLPSQAESTPQQVSSHIVQGVQTNAVESQ